MGNIDRVKSTKLTFKDTYQRLLNNETDTFGIKAGHVMLKAGESIDEHTTGEREEVIIILKGKGEALIENKKVFKLEDNMVLYTPPDLKHDIRNTGTDILEYIFVTVITDPHRNNKGCDAGP